MNRRYSNIRPVRRYTPRVVRHPTRSYCSFCGEYGGVGAEQHFRDAPLCWDDLLGFHGHRQEDEHQGHDDPDGG